MENKGKKLKIPVKYKKLPKFCFQCGRIAHTTKCNEAGTEEDQEQFGTWLKADTVRRDLVIGTPG